ncbi:unnamed protein product [Ranitomeya imitator]|uniref:Reverse transcriptase domain-containing protein n=1 Tax=Ranitomeya imitator TaxID=111125 RepID=A0ABN9MJT4_9NEOB|nr:unnamed protein product [Ranitomeya imitator]
MLPKVHKSLTNPPGRPIVASTNSILSPLSIFLEKYLTPFVKKTKSFVLDTGHFISIIKRISALSPQCLLATLDVKSLYTAIKHDLGLKAVKNLLRTSDLGPQAQYLILDLLSIVLRENFFLFGDQFYLQTCGTAMGSNMAPAYAMDTFENEYVYNNALFKLHSKCWLQYIDDVFCLWDGPADTFALFVSQINGARPELQFTPNCDTNKIPFLDTLVIKNNQGCLDTDIYTKPTDSNNLLLFSSCHPKSTRESLPRSQFRRVTNIVSNTNLTESRLDDMVQKFRDRDYPDRILQKEKTRALEYLPSRSQSPKQERIPFIHTHHPTMPLIYKTINKHWPLLKEAYPQVAAFQAPALMCKRRPRNFRDSLVKADIRSLTKQPRQQFLGTQRTGTFPCLGCACCANVIKSSEFTHPHTGKKFNIKGFYTCETNFVVYLVKCPCGLMYVGETIQHVRDRISSHKSTIRLKKTWLPLPHHFVTANHSVSQLQYQVIERVERPRWGGDHIKLLKERESFWIYTLQTLAPRGLNRELDFTF